MKNNNFKHIIKYCLLVALLLIGLSCDEAGALNPNASPEYVLTMNVIGSNDSYFADSCEGCEDPNPIEAQVSLTNNNVPVSGAEIIFTYQSDDISISDPFEISSIETSNSGIATAYYNDNGETGTMSITATYLNPAYPDTAWTSQSENLIISPYYTLVNSFELLVNDADPQIIAGATNSNSALEVNVRVKDANGLPLQYMPIMFSSDNTSIVFSTLEVFSDEYGYATVVVTHPQESANGIETVNISARLNYPGLTVTEAKLTNVEIPIIEPPTPEFTLTLEIDTDYDLIDYDLNGDGTADGNYYYADGQSKLVKFIARLQTSSSSFSVYNQPILLSWDGDGALVNSEGGGFNASSDGLTNANGYVYFWFDDNFDPENVTFTASYDYQQDNQIDANASISAEFVPYYLAIDEVTMEPLGGETTVVSGYDEESIDYISVKVTIVDDENRGLENLEVSFSALENPELEGEPLGTFITDSNLLTNEQGEVTATWMAYIDRQGGSLTISASIVDDNDGTYNQTVNFTVSPPFYGDVSEMNLQVDPVDPILIESTIPEYTATFTARVLDDDGAGLPAVVVDFQMDDESVGGISPTTCTTNSDGECEISASVGYSSIDMKDSLFVFSCITVQSLANAGIEIVPSLNTESNIEAYKPNKKGKALNKTINKSFKSILNSNMNDNLSPYSSRNDCEGFADSAKVILVEKDLFYIEQVEFLELYTDPNTLIIEQGADSSFTIYFRAATGTPNVPVKFQNLSESIAPLSSSKVYTDDNGYAIVSAIINPDDVGNDFLVNAYIEDLLNPISEIPLFESSNTISITNPIYNYTLTLAANTSDSNYSDNNVTTTDILVTLTDDLSIPLAGKIISTLITNSDNSFAQGSLTNLNTNGLTDYNGQIAFDYNDNGQAGQIELTATYVDEYGNTASNNVAFVVQPVENLVTTLSLVSNPIGPVLTNSENSTYTTEFTASVSDADGNAVPNVEILFQNGTDTNPALGQLSSSCFTDTEGLCINNLTSNYNEIGTAEIQACVTYETLQQLVAISGKTISFPELENYNKKITKRNKDKSTKNIFKSLIQNTLTTTSSGEQFCSDGVSTSYELDFINENIYYSDLVDNVNIISDPANTVMVGDTSNYNTILYVTASDDNNAGLPSVPISLSILTEFGTISPQTCTTDEFGNCQATLNTTNEISNLGAATIQACATLASPLEICNQHSLNFITNEQMQCDQVNDILTWITVGENIIDNSIISVVDTIFARTLDINSQPVSDVPISFKKINDDYNLGYLVSNSATTDSLGLAYAVYTPDFSQYDGEDDFITVEFEVGVECENNDLAVQFDIEVENQNSNNIEYQVEYFNFFPNSSTYFHLLGDNSLPEILVKDEFGVGICNVPVNWKLYQSDEIGNIQGSCADNNGVALPYTSPLADCFENGFNWDDAECTDDAGIILPYSTLETCQSNGAQWINSYPNGTLSAGLTYTWCIADSAAADTTGNISGTTGITYINQDGGSDVLAAYIKDPFQNRILKYDSIFFETNAVSSIHAWAQDPTINVTTTDSVYCDTLYAIALDQNGQALPEISLNFQLDTGTYDGVIYPVNSMTGVNSEPGSALYCPEQGFVGNVEINVNHSTTSAIVEDIISIEYIDNIPECEDCIAELILIADEYILPYGVDMDQTLTIITATMTDSAGYDPPVNTLCAWQAIQQNEDGDWVDVGSIDEFSYFEATANVLDGEDEVEATTTFQMYDAAGLVTIVGSAAEYGLTDTIYINTITTQPSYIEIIPPFPNEIMVQGGGGIESTDVDVAIKDGTGNYISIPFWVRFTLMGSPIGCNMDGDDDDNGVVDVLSQNGISTVSVISGSRPGAVQLRVELYPDVNGLIDDSDSPIASAEGTPVTIATGPPAEGVINYSYVDITTIGGGLYQIPVSVDIWDVHSNPVADSTNVYFSVRGLAPAYNSEQLYLAGDQVYWKSDSDLDSLVYECIAPLDVPDNIPPPFNGAFEAFTCQKPNDLYSIETDVDLLGGVLWDSQNHPANIEPVAKTGNESPQNESFPGKAWTYLYYSSSTMFDETVLFAQTYGSNGQELVIDSRESHDGASLVLPFTPEGTIGLSVNPGSGQLTAAEPELFVTVTASLTDYYQYYIDNGILSLNAPGATIVNVCDGIDQDGDGSGICFDDANGDGVMFGGEEQLPFNTCTVCGENGGTWAADDGDNDGFPDDGIPDDDPIYGITNNSGQVTWTIRYDLGINICENCGENNAQCNDFDSNITVTLLNPQGGVSDPQTVTVIQPFPEDACP